MKYDIPNLSPEDRDKFKAIFVGLIGYCNRNIYNIKDRSFWKKFLDPKSFELSYWTIMKDTIETISKIFEEGIETVDIKDDN